MADNAVFYGFRWASSINGKSCPHGQPMIVASSHAFTPGSATAANLRVGDPVARITGGFIDHADPGGVVWGIVVGLGHDGKVFNSTIGTTGVLHPSTVIPSGVAYGTNLDNQTIAMVVPAGGAYWEVDSDQVKADQAAWQAIAGLNADHSFNAPAAGSLSATPRIGVEVAATGTAQWRIEHLSSNAANQDFSGANVKLIVTLNEGQAPPFGTASI